MLLTSRCKDLTIAIAQNADLGHEGSSDQSSRWFSKAGVFMVAVCFLGLAGTCRAENICPWMNVATASGYLGGPAAVTVNQVNESTGTCVFKLLSGKATDSLTISVTQVQDGETELTSYEHRCVSSTVPLKAIGNEAVMCADTTTPSTEEQIIGRVRDSIFVISLSAPEPAGRAATGPSLAEKVRAAAEQVAGNLF